MTVRTLRDHVLQQCGWRGRSGESKGVGNKDGGMATYSRVAREFCMPASQAAIPQTVGELDARNGGFVYRCRDGEHAGFDIDVVSFLTAN